MDQTANATSSPQVITDRVSLRYDYALGEVAGRFMEGLKQGKILATRCSKSGMTYLPPRSFCERSFEPCELMGRSWQRGRGGGIDDRRAWL